MILLLKWNIAIGLFWLFTSIYPGLLEQWQLIFLILIIPLFFGLLPYVTQLTLGTMAFWEIQSQKETERYLGWVVQIVVILLSPLIFPFSSAGLVLWLGNILLKLRSDYKTKTLRSMVLLGIILITIQGAFWTNFPLRLGLLISRPAFTSVVESASLGNSILNRYLGIYHVEDYTLDGKGVVYFRTRTTNWWGSDGTEYGFAYQPNSLTYSLENSSYNYQHLFGNWYTFETSRRNKGIKGKSTYSL